MYIINKNILQLATNMTLGKNTVRPTAFIQNTFKNGVKLKNL
jgi:hypothetical protein